MVTLATLVTLATSATAFAAPYEYGLELVGLRIVQKKAKEFYYRRYSGFNTLVIRM